MPEASAPENEGLGCLAVLIPAWQPEPCLVSLASDLCAAGIGLILVVDDGSAQTSQPVFHELRRRDVRVLRHGANLGKGRALKTGFNALLAEYSQIRGVVTADADGQHTTADILRLATVLAASLESPHPRPVLGMRSFDTRVPLRSRLGNTLTRTIFAFITGTRLSDTQTGLRGFPASLLPSLITLDGEHYEYEMTVLAHLCRDPRERPLEVPISTVYIAGNRSSHFNPIRDSMRIYFVLARFYASSMLAATIDFAGFAVAFAATHNIVASVAFGRLSSLVNFALNRRFVFRNRSPLAAALWRYYALAFTVAAISCGLIWLLSAREGWNVFAAKLAVDILLSLVSFSVQTTFVFDRAEPV